MRDDDEGRFFRCAGARLPLRGRLQTDKDTMNEHVEYSSLQRTNKVDDRGQGDAGQCTQVGCLAKPYGARMREGDKRAYTRRRRDQRV